MAVLLGCIGDDHTGSSDLTNSLVKNGLSTVQPIGALDIDKTNVLPPITAYSVMKIGKLPLIPYFPPSYMDLAKVVGEMASSHHAVLLANHGPIVAGKSLKDAVYATEELEETAKLFLLLKDRKTQFLNQTQVNAIENRFQN